VYYSNTHKTKSLLNFNRTIRSRKYIRLLNDDMVIVNRYDNANNRTPTNYEIISHNLNDVNINDTVCYLMCILMSLNYIKINFILQKV